MILLSYLSWKQPNMGCLRFGVLAKSKYQKQPIQNYDKCPEQQKTNSKFVFHYIFCSCVRNSVLSSRNVQCTSNICSTTPSGITYPLRFAFFSRILISPHYFLLYCICYVKAQKISKSSSLVELLEEKGILAVSEWEKRVKQNTPIKE